MHPSHLAVTLNRRRRRPSVVAAGATISANVVLARTSGIAPLYVHFDATGTTSTQTSLPFHELWYRWNFGDGSAGNWTKGAALGSKNTDEGPIAGHVYETGSATPYAPYVDIYDGTSLVRHYTDTVTVTAADSAAEFATTKTVVVNNVGDADFSAKPTGATELTTNSLQTAMAALTGSVKRIMFKRGGTWESTAAIAKNLAGPIQICAYGTGAKPIWQASAGFTSAAGGGGTQYITIGSQSQFVAGDFRVMDIEMDASLIADNKNIRGFFALGTVNQITLLRLTYRSMTMGVNLSDSLLTINEASWPGQEIWDQLAIVDCEHLDTPNSGGGGTSGSIPYGDFFSGERYFYAGNDTDLNATTVQETGSHGVRIQYSYKGIIAHNSIANPGNGRHHIKAHGPVWTETSLGAGDWTPKPADITTTQGGGAGYTRYLLIADNKLTQNATNGSGWFISAQPQGGVPSNYSRNKDQIIERNLTIANAAHLSSVMSSAEQSTIRNNVAILTGSNVHTAWSTRVASVAAGWVCADTWIYNNSSYSADANSGEYAISVGAGCTGAVVKNNLHYAPNDATGGLLTDAGTGTVSGNNTTNIQTDPAFAGADLTVLANWATSGYTTGAGAVVPVRGDLLGTARPASALKIGAVE